MIAWVGGIWLGGMVMAFALAAFAGRADDHTEAVSRELGLFCSEFDDCEVPHNTARMPPPYSNASALALQAPRPLG